MPSNCSPLTQLSDSDVQVLPKYLKEANFKNIPFSKLFIPLSFIAILLISIGSVLYLFMRGNEYSDKPIFHLHRLFSPDSEANLTTWYSSALWLIFGLSGFLIAFLSRTSQESEQHNLKWGAIFLGCVGIYASIDETGQLHETLSYVGGILLPDLVVDVSLKWVLPGLLLALIVGFILLHFVMRLPKNIKIGVFIGATVFLIGALGIELLSLLWIYKFGMDAYYHLFVAFEELFEKMGLIIALSSLLSFVQYNSEIGIFRLQPQK